MSTHVTTREKWTAVAVMEMVAVMIALVLPVTPSKTGPPGIPWPASLGDYLTDVLLCFGLVNGVLVVLILIIWGYCRAKGLPFWAEEPAAEEASQMGTKTE